jgi:hypothetical protein
MTDKINYENNQLEDINVSLPKVLLDRIIKCLEKDQTIQEFVQEAIQEKLEK